MSKGAGEGGGGGKWKEVTVEGMPLPWGGDICGMATLNCEE